MKHRLTVRLLRLLSLLVSTFLLLPAKGQEKAKMADLAVDIAGINTHLYYPGVYTDRYGDIIKPRLQELGVRHLRDGNPVGNATFDTRVKELAGLGMKFILICDTRFGLATSLTASKDHIKSLNTDVNKPVLMVEGPNEFDCPNQSGFMAELTTTTKNLWNTFKGDGATSSIPVAGPSFCNTASSPGNFANSFTDATNYMQYGNLHPYPAGLHVEGSGGGGWGINFDEAVRRYKLVSGSDPLIITETGYKMSGDVEGHISVTQRAAAKYIPRSLLYYLNKGITRTYLYQLINDSEDFGILNNDGTPRQQFTALKNYISLLKDPGAAFDPGSLTYSLSGDLTNIHRTLLQKRDGRFYLILWQGVNSCNPGQVNVEPAARNITLNLTTQISSAKVYLPTFNGTTAQSTHTNPTSISLSVPDHIVIVELTPSTTTTYYRIKNRWKGNYLYDGGDYVKYGTGTDQTYHWVFEDFDGHKRIKNRSTGQYMHVENLTGSVQCTATTAGWYSNHWVFEDLDGHKRIRNRWQNTAYIHVENQNGNAQYGVIHAGAYSNQWLFEAVPSTAREGVEELSDASIMLSPNPATDQVQLQLPEGKAAQVVVTNLQGRMLLTKQVNAKNTELNVASLSAGIYLVKVTVAGKTTTKKLLIQR